MEDEKWMQAALELARQAAQAGEVPVGCVVVRGNEIVGRGSNRRETGKNALHHAELLAIDEACCRLGGWRLWECTLYVTLEPCPMCAGAILNARIPRVVCGRRTLRVFLTPLTGGERMVLRRFCVKSRESNGKRAKMHRLSA